jgi:hypothetical protein
MERRRSDEIRKRAMKQEEQGSRRSGETWGGVTKQVEEQ